MSTKTSKQSGMLNRYLHEHHPVDEKVRSTASGRNTHSKIIDGDEAVKQLDKEMARKTDPRLLREARHEQRGMRYISTICCGFELIGS